MLYSGFIDNHPRARETYLGNKTQPAGSPCGGGGLFDVPETQVYADRPKWQVESWNPLTLSQSLLCTVCGNHGFIRDGQWVPV